MEETDLQEDLVQNMSVLDHSRVQGTTSPTDKRTQSSPQVYNCFVLVCASIIADIPTCFSYYEIRYMLDFSVGMWGCKAGNCCHGQAAMVTQIWFMNELALIPFEAKAVLCVNGP